MPKQRAQEGGREQVFNGVAPCSELQELVDVGVPMDELTYLEAPSRELLDKLDPIYSSYFVEWNGIKNYEFAKRRGFKDLTHEWDRTNHIENFNQIAVMPAEDRDHYAHPKIVEDFCSFTGMTTKEFYESLDKLYSQ